MYAASYRFSWSIPALPMGGAPSCRKLSPHAPVGSALPEKIPTAVTAAVVSAASNINKSRFRKKHPLPWTSYALGRGCIQTIS